MSDYSFEEHLTIKHVMSDITGVAESRHRDDIHVAVTGSRTAGAGQGWGTGRGRTFCGHQNHLPSRAAMEGVMKARITRGVEQQAHPDGGADLREHFPDH